METIQKIWNKKFVLLFITNLLVLAAFYASIPIIPVYCQEIGITGSGIGIVLTAMSVATILFRPIIVYICCFWLYFVWHFPVSSRSPFLAR